MKRLGLLTLLVTFLAPLALQASVLEHPNSISGYEIGDSGVLAAGKEAISDIDAFMAKTLTQSLMTLPEPGR